MTQPWSDPKWVKEEDKQSRLSLARENLDMAKRLAASAEVVSVAQGLLTCLNVGDIKSESLIHLKIRETMIEYRKKIAEIDELANKYKA